MRNPLLQQDHAGGLIAHYHAIADSGVLPVMVYNVPARTGLNIAPATLQAICRHENVIAVKEANPDVAQAIEKLRLCGEDVAFYSGSDELNWPLMACRLSGGDLRGLQHAAPGRGGAGGGCLAGRCGRSGPGSSWPCSR